MSVDANEHIRQAITHHRSGNLPAAASEYMKALAIFEREGDELAAAKTHNSLGAVAMALRDAQTATRECRAALEIVERLGDEESVAAVCSNMGVLCRQLGSYEEAVGYYERALEIRQRLGDDRGMVDLYNNLSIVYRRMGDLERSSQALQQALPIAERLGDRTELLRTHDNAGRLAFDAGDPAGAVEAYERALALRDAADDAWIGDIQNRLGAAHVTLGNTAAATENLRSALAIREKLGDYAGMASTCGNLGHLYLANGRPQHARPVLAWAFLAFGMVGSENQDAVGDQLIEACGSAEAAEAYLDSFIAEYGEHAGPPPAMPA